LQAAEGTGLAFIVFTQAIVELPGAPFWSCIFFLMLLALGLGSQIGILEGMLCVIFEIDLFKRIKKQYMTGERGDDCGLSMSVERNPATSQMSRILIFIVPICGFRSRLRRVLFRGAYLLHRCRRILAKDVRQLCGHHRSRHGRAHGDDFRDLRVRSRKVS